MTRNALHQPKRVLILGSGFGGLYTALRLEKKLRRAPNVEVTLVNRENFFLFTPMLHEVAAGDLDVTHICKSSAEVAAMLAFFQWRHSGNQLSRTQSYSHHNYSEQTRTILAKGKSSPITSSLRLRTIYLSKLPRFEKKVRVALDWALDHAT